MFRRASVFCLALVMLVSTKARAVMDEPPTKDVQFWIHEDASNPNSDVIMKISCKLQRASLNGNSAAWQVVTVNFTRPANGSTPELHWVDAYPDVKTSDGLWWVTHADPTTPLQSEFSLPPQIEGVAGSVEKVGSLPFTLKGLPYTPPTGGPPWQGTGKLDYALSLPSPMSPIQNTGEVEMPWYE